MKHLFSLEKLLFAIISVNTIHTIADTQLDYMPSSYGKIINLEEILILIGIRYG